MFPLFSYKEVDWADQVDSLVFDLGERQNHYHRNRLSFLKIYLKRGSFRLKLVSRRQVTITD